MLKICRTRCWPVARVGVVYDTNSSGNVYPQNSSQLDVRSCNSDNVQLGRILWIRIMCMSRRILCGFYKMDSPPCTQMSTWGWDVCRTFHPFVRSQVLTNIARDPPTVWGEAPSPSKDVTHGTSDKGEGFVGRICKKLWGYVAAFVAHVKPPEKKSEKDKEHDAEKIAHDKAKASSSPPPDPEVLAYAILSRNF